MREEFPKRLLSQSEAYQQVLCIMPSPIGSDAAAKQFLAMLIEAGVTSESPDFGKAWQVFQEFCEYSNCPTDGLSQRNS